MISIRIGRGGDDVALRTHALADLTWLRPRLADFLKLAPGLGLEASAAPRAMLLCPEFARETRAAVENLPHRSIELATYHCLRQHGQLSVLLETESPSQPQKGEASIAETHGTGTDPGRHTRSQPAPTASHHRTDPPSPSGFRTGLTDADLRIEVEEEKSLD